MKRLRKIQENRAAFLLVIAVLLLSISFSYGQASSTQQAINDKGSLFIEKVNVDDKESTENENKKVTGTVFVQNFSQSKNYEDVEYVIDLRQIKKDSPSLLEVNVFSVSKGVSDFMAGEQTEIIFDFSLPRKAYLENYTIGVILTKGEDVLSVKEFELLVNEPEVELFDNSYIPLVAEKNDVEMMDQKNFNQGWIIVLVLGCSILIVCIIFLIKRKRTSEKNKFLGVLFFIIFSTIAFANISDALANSMSITGPSQGGVYSTDSDVRIVVKLSINNWSLIPKYPGCFSDGIEEYNAQFYIRSRVTLDGSVLPYKDVGVGYCPWGIAPYLSYSLGSGSSLGVGTHTAAINISYLLGGGFSTPINATRTFQVVAPVNGACGPAATSYLSIANAWKKPFCSSGDFCGDHGWVSGEPTGSSLPSFLSSGTSYSWMCAGEGSGTTNKTCTASRYSVASITASPNPIQVCDGTGLGITNVTWNAPGFANTEIHMSSATGTLFASGGPTGSKLTGKWVANGTTFVLIVPDYYPGFDVTLKNLTLTTTTAGCPVIPPPSCTGSIPSGSTMCSSDNVGLTSSLPWAYVGTSSSSCTTARKCQYYTVPATNNRPTATITAPSGNRTITAGGSISFSGYGSDSDGSITNYQWLNGSCSANLLSSSSSFTRSFSTPGTYRIYFRVRDNDGAWSTNCPYRTITVNPVTYSCTGSIPSESTMCSSDNIGLTSTLAWAYVGTSSSSCTTARKCQYYTVPATNNRPTATITAPSGNRTITAGGSISFSGYGSDSDGSITNYQWLNGSCSANLLSSSSSFTRSFSTPGTYRIYFRVRDNDGAWSTNCPSRLITVFGCENFPLGLGYESWALDESTGLLSNSNWVYSSLNTSAKCQYKCSTGYEWNSGTSTCDLITYNCQNFVPTNAESWGATEEVGLTNNTTNWEYSTSNTVTKCEYKCISPNVYNTATLACVPPTCIGNIPSNADLCPSDSTGLTADVGRTLVGSCGAPKCEYICKTGFTYNSGSGECDSNSSPNPSNWKEVAP